MSKSKEDNRDIYDKVGDYLIPTALGTGLAIFGGSAGRKIAKRTLKEDAAERAAKGLGPRFSEEGSRRFVKANEGGLAVIGGGSGIATGMVVNDARKKRRK